MGGKPRQSLKNRYEKKLAEQARQLERKDMVIDAFKKSFSFQHHHLKTEAEYWKKCFVDLTEEIFQTPKK